MPLMHRLAVILSINFIAYVFVLYCLHFSCLILYRNYSSILHILDFFIAYLYKHTQKKRDRKTADVRTAERCQPVPFGRRWFCWRGLRGWLTGTLCCPGKLGWLTEACDPWVGGDWSFSLSQEPSLLPVGNEYILFGWMKTPNFQFLNLEARPAF